MEEYIRQLGNSVISMILIIRDFAEHNNLLDSQSYLNFLDKLNELSLDQDRK